jgi:hypothetical protein
MVSRKLEKARAQEPIFSADLRAGSVVSLALHKPRDFVELVLQVAADRQRSARHKVRQKDTHLGGSGASLATRPRTPSTEHSSRRPSGSDYPANQTKAIAANHRNRATISAASTGQPRDQG